MIRELAVENLAVIESTRIEFEAGFTALTGETGAGKSLLVDSVQLALGGRADSDLVRHGCSVAVVTLKVDLDGMTEALKLCEQLGVVLDDHELVIHREVSSQGRSTVRLNGRTFNAGSLRSLGQLIVDLHGQHDHQALLSTDRQLEFFDQWAGSEVVRAREATRQAFEQLADARSKLARGRLNSRERDQRIDLLSFQIGEISEAGLSIGETERIANLLVKLRGLDKIGSAAQSALTSLIDSEGSAGDLVGDASKQLSQVSHFDNDLALLSDQLARIQDDLWEFTKALRHYADSNEVDLERLEETAERAETLSKLHRKYGDDDEAVLDFLAKAKLELEELQLGQEGSEALESLVQSLEQGLADRCESLSQLRAKHAKAFDKAVMDHVRDLALERASFSTKISRGAPTPTGADHLEFMFSANVGEPERPLEKVASGGELSRLMLAIKVASAGRAGVPTLIFDEVDAGLSGMAGAVVAKKLVQLAEQRQVIVISHLPQVASRAKDHFRIEKVEIANRTSTVVNHLTHEDRIHEIARMLAGEKVGPSALANARELVGFA